jgi:hypothetical protein
MPSKQITVPCRLLYRFLYARKNSELVEKVGRTDKALQMAMKDLLDEVDLLRGKTR